MSDLGLGLILAYSAVMLIGLVFVVLKQVAVVKGQQKLNESMQAVSEQMTDLEERLVEAQNDVRKLTQHFINFARGMKGTSGKTWDQTL